MFSMVTGAPKELFKALDAVRAIVSTPEPAAIGRIRRTGRPLCANAAGAPVSAAPALAASSERREI